MADSQQVTVIEDGQAKKVWKYTLVNPLITNGEIRYGQFYYDDAGRTTYTENGVGQPMGKTDLFTGVLFYQPIGETESTATVTYVDDTTGETLATETLTGVVGTTSDYRTAATISGYTDQGYVLKGDDYPAAGVTFTANAQTFTVHLTHGTQTISNSKRVTQTIHYVYADGTPAAPDYTAWLTFTRTGTRDQVTGTEVWGAWQNIDGRGGFAAKSSPVIAGYTADQPTVAAVTNVTATSADLTATVTYTVKGTVVPVLPEKPELEDDVLEPGPTEGGLAATALADSQQVAQRLDNLAAQGTSNVGGRPTTLTGTSGTTQATAAETETATRLPQTNDRTTAWSWLGALGLSLLGWVGLRRRH